mmetsp:Transcript_43647/g.120727  ORF Transcript_43647/g.120727 Transcript_43647/m.120727 type:complete len:209 (-) Transcript_43647:763-1389(-)
MRCTRRPRAVAMTGCGARREASLERCLSSRPARSVPAGSCSSACGPPTQGTPRPHSSRSPPPRRATFQGGACWSPADSARCSASTAPTHRMRARQLTSSRKMHVRPLASPSTAAARSACRSLTSRRVTSATCCRRSAVSSSSRTACAATTRRRSRAPSCARSASHSARSSRSSSRSSTSHPTPSTTTPSPPPTHCGCAASRRCARHST